MKKDELKKEDNLIIEEHGENNGEVVQVKDQEAPGEKEKEVLKSILPTSYKKLNSKPANTFYKMESQITGGKSDGQIELLISNKGEIYSRISLTYEGELEGKIKNLTAFDNCVLDAICTLWSAGNSVFSLSDLHKIVYGKKGESKDIKITKNQKEKLLNSLYKLNATRLYLDFSKEVENNLITIDGEKITNCVWDGAIINFDKINVITENGREIEAISLIKEPFLYTYSSAKNQILSFNIELSQLPEGINGTDENIIIRDYLLCNVNQIIRGYRNNNIITYKAILQELKKENETMSRTEKKRITDIVTNFLDYFCTKFYEKEGIIINFDVLKKRNSIYGFEILF